MGAFFGPFDDLAAGFAEEFGPWWSGEEVEEVAGFGLDSGSFEGFGVHSLISMEFSSCGHTKSAKIEMLEGCI